MELFLCRHQAIRVYPMIDLQLSGTKKDDMLLSDEQKEGLRAIRKVLASTTNGEAVVQLIDMMQKTHCNADLLNRLRDWITLWEKKAAISSAEHDREFPCPARLFCGFYIPNVGVFLTQCGENAIV